MTVIKEDGSVKIPKRLLKKFKLTPGSKIIFDTDKNRILIQKTSDRIEKWWSAYTYLAEEISYCADKLEKNLKGYPGEFDKGFKESSKYSKENEQKWRNILIKIRDGFKIWAETNGDFHEWKDGKTLPFPKFTKSDDGYYTMEADPSGYKLIENTEKKRKFKEAMRLFSKYYEHLWD